MNKESNSSKFRPLIVGGSVIIPLAVALIYYAPKLKVDYDFSFLPSVYASINAITALCLISAFIAIMKKKIKLHKALMSTAILLSVLFLLLYILYHITTPSTSFGGQGIIKTIYFMMLISHIVLSVVVVPLVLITYSRALAERFDKHKKIARWTFPIWLYVAISGVIVYRMIAPYY